MVLTFSQPVRVEDFANSLTFEMKKEDTTPFIQFEVEKIERVVQPNRNHQIKITLKFSTDITNGTFIINPKSPEVNLSIFKSDLNNSNTLSTETSLIISKITHIDSILSKPLEITSKTLGYSFNLLVLAMMLLNMPMAVTMIKLYQSFGILVLINIDLPANITNFFDFFKNDMFNLLPEIELVNEENMDCATRAKFEDEEFSCSVLNNTSMIIIQFIILGLLKLVLSLSVHLLKKKERKNTLLDVKKVQIFNKMDNNSNSIGSGAQDNKNTHSQ